VQRQQLPTESQVLEDEVLPGTENADQPAEEMSERHDHDKNLSGKIRIQPFAKSFIQQVYDVLARHTGKKWISWTAAPEKMDAAFQELNAALDAFRETHKKT